MLTEAISKKKKLGPSEEFLLPKLLFPEELLQKRLEKQRCAQRRKYITESLAENK